MIDREQKPVVEINYAPLPATAVQALYHAVTGKTENLTKHFKKHFIVREPDVRQLHLRLLQQFEHYYLVCAPTTTIKMNFDNRESQLYSSWERFQLYEKGKIEIVSDVILKYEFIIKLPDIEKVQRYIVNIDIDSKLPLLKDDAGEVEDFFLFDLEQMPSLTVSIDFIDYITAKNILQTVEDWHKSLEETSNSKWLSILRNRSIRWSVAFQALGSSFTALFVFIYTLLRKGNLGTPAQICNLIALSIFFYPIFGFLCYQAGIMFSRRLSRSVIPAVILLTAGDDRLFTTVKEKKIFPDLVKYCLALVISLAINILASFAYAWLIS